MMKWWQWLLIALGIVGCGVIALAAIAYEDFRAFVGALLGGRLGN